MLGKTFCFPCELLNPRVLFLCGVSPRPRIHLVFPMLNLQLKNPNNDLKLSQSSFGIFCWKLLSRAFCSRELVCFAFGICLQKLLVCFKLIFIGGIKDGKITSWTGFSNMVDRLVYFSS